MIHIVMCTYNGEKYISQQLESIANNTVGEWKLYICDDKSTDNTIKILTDFRNEYVGRVDIKINENKKGAVLNFLNIIQEVSKNLEKDDYIMLCDQDDVWNEDKIAVTLAGMQELISSNDNDIPLLVCTDVTVVDEKLDTIAESFTKMNHYNTNKLTFANLMMENKVQGCTVMINKALTDKIIRLPAGAVMHDSWIGLIAAAFGKIKYINEPTMKYRQHTGNVMGSIGFWEDMKNKLSCLDKQRQIVMKTTAQLGEFIDIYGQELPKEVYVQAKAFATLSKQNFFVKRYNIIKYKMWKSGIFRNIGLMLLI